MAFLEIIEFIFIYLNGLTEIRKIKLFYSFAFIIIYCLLNFVTLKITQKRFCIKLIKYNWRLSSQDSLDATPFFVRTVNVGTSMLKKLIIIIWKDLQKINSNLESN